MSITRGARFVSRIVLAGLMMFTVAARGQTAPASQPSAVEQWGIYEVALKGPTDGNPFDTQISAKFTLGNTSVEARGFYDGDGMYRIRFMPPQQGTWTYETKSDRPELSGKTGEFACGKPSPGNHGPVRVANTFHFTFADGTPYIPVSTTIYGWAQQRDQALEERTLESLKTLPFNRVRMTVLPISYGPDNVPPHFPFAENPDTSWIYSKFVPAFFQHVEKRIGQLRDMGIEAELVLFHNRDNGLTALSDMPAAIDDRFVSYVVARFSSYRNVWWSLANEFDGISTKKDSDWDRIFQLIQAQDPYGHLRSIHQIRRYYDFNKPWVTHLSVQNEMVVEGFGRCVIYRNLFRKPVVFDEIKYEGNIPQSWGRLSGQELTCRFWLTAIGGTYGTHGETFQNAPGVAWISRGGSLVGESPKRIAFLKKILDEAPPGGINPIDQGETWGMVGAPGYALVYFGKHSPTEYRLRRPAGRGGGSNFKVDIIDTWNMTITPYDQPINFGRQGPATAPAEGVPIPLPGRPFMALRVQRAAN